MAQEQVNVHTHAINARKRANGSGPLRPVGGDPPENAETPPTATGWRKYFKWEHLTMATGRTIEKGWVVPQPLGIALIVLILSGVIGIYWHMDGRINAKDEAYQAQRDMLIEIKTELKIQKEHELEYRQEQRQINGETQAWQQITNKEVAQLKERLK